MENYWPVSNLPVLEKIVEKVVGRYLQRLLEEIDYLFQFGFAPRYDIEKILVMLVDHLCWKWDRGSASILLLLDLSATCDAVIHGIPVGWLLDLGMGSTIPQWFTSFLSSQFQSLLMVGETASMGLTWGVFQGLTLSPLMFNICMKPLGEVIQKFGLWYHQYADDT